MATKDELIDIGFYPVPNFNIGNSLLYDLGYCKRLSVSNVDTCNEILWIEEHNIKDYTDITDIICLHNYDYSGALLIDKVKKLIELLSVNKKSQNISPL